MKLEDSPFTKALPTKKTPHQPDGSFGWLAQTSVHDEWAIGNEKAGDLPSQLDSAIASAKDNGLSLPEEFITFVRSPGLHKHLRSANVRRLKT